MSTKTERITFDDTRIQARLEHEAQLQNISVGKLIRNRFERDGSKFRRCGIGCFAEVHEGSQRALTRSTKAWTKLRRRLRHCASECHQDAIAAMKESCC